ncbi:hypothetical protein FNJ88_06525 [Chryseobacterium sp. SNU WT5]|uniref:hypothetical protein n=1 Tax=Chryseobacterium sp. SNU WT5 TaxID=2594269 RepID=UPI00117C86DB|nr:hypothetical protein [Chryseobacterium sp. SNU WT5]QDP85176.1 hypothetical protein FNJ88_06215 [Chryseobacterium sp. SNU WT5]QDP85237.1 hypothetical protein FNJ88_06525 [Chryseobacterium sp. SNU WT5]
MLNAFLRFVFEKNFASNAFSRPLSRNFPATEKDFFAHASTTRNKEKMRHRFSAVIKRKAVAERKEMWICGKSQR